MQEVKTTVWLWQVHSVYCATETPQFVSSGRAHAIDPQTHKIRLNRGGWFLTSAVSLSRKIGNSISCWKLRNYERMRRTDWCLQQHYEHFRLTFSVLSLQTSCQSASTNHSCCKCHAHTGCSALRNLINLHHLIWETVKWKPISSGSSKTPAIYNP